MVMKTPARATHAKKVKALARAQRRRREEIAEAELQPTKGTAKPSVIAAAEAAKAAAETDGAA